MKERKESSSEPLEIISVEDLTIKEFKNMGLYDFCWVNPYFKYHFVALGRDKEGNVLKARAMHGIDEERFLAGDEEYLSEVLKKAEKMLTFEEKKINIAHVKNLSPEYIEERKRRRPGWKVIFSGDRGYNSIIIWETPRGFWLEERGNTEIMGEYRWGLIRSCLLTGPMIKDVIEKTSEELAKLQQQEEVELE